MSLPGRFLDIGGQRVFYHRSGSGRGRTVVLVHGYAISHWEWRHVIPALAREHDVIAFDLPGFGESDRPRHGDYRYDASAFLETLVGVLDSLNIERATLVGHSMGGGVSLYAAARRPERVDRLVAIDPLVYPFPMPPEGRLLLVPYVGPIIFRTLYARGIVKRTMQRLIYVDPALATDEWVDYVWERMNRPGGFEAAHAALTFLAEPSAVARSLRAVRAPTLVVWGADDRLFPATHAARVAAEIPGAVSRLIPRCGHSPPEEKPAELLDIVLPFLARSDERPAAVAS